MNIYFNIYLKEDVNLIFCKNFKSVCLDKMSLSEFCVILDSIQQEFCNFCLNNQGTYELLVSNKIPRKGEIIK